MKKLFLIVLFLPLFMVMRQPEKRNIIQVRGVTSTPSIPSGSWRVLNEMDIVITTSGRPVLLKFHGRFYNSSTTRGAAIEFRREGVQTGFATQNMKSAASQQWGLQFDYIDYVPAGTYRYQVYWTIVGDYTAYAYSNSRIFTVEEL